MREETLSYETPFSGQLVRLEVHQVRLPDGSTARREVVRHCGAACAVVFDRLQRCVLVRQYRKALEQVLLEIPAGKLDPGELPDQAIRRELHEEIGFVEGRIERLFEFYPAPGFCDEKITAYLVSEAVLAENRPDPGEFLEIVFMDRAQLEAAIEAGEFADAKSLACILEALRRGVV